MYRTSTNSFLTDSHVTLISAAYNLSRTLAKSKPL